MVVSQSAWPVGLRANIPHAEYHQKVLGVASKSGLDKVARSPAHYKAWIDGYEQSTDATRFGSAFHCAILEPNVFAETYAVEPDFGDCRVKTNKADRDAWRAEHSGSVLLSPDDMRTIECMVKSVKAHPLASRMIRDGEPEITVQWIDEETGLRCKARADYYVRKLDMVLDAKTTEDASEEKFAKSIVRYRYHVQDALYRFGFDAVGSPIKHFALIGVEKEPPYAVGIYTLDAEAIGKGYSRARQDLNVLADCVRTNQWPAYTTSIKTICLPPWA